MECVNSPGGLTTHGRIPPVRKHVELIFHDIGHVRIGTQVCVEVTLLPFSEDHHILLAPNDLSMNAHRWKMDLWGSTAALVLVASLVGCATGRYTPLAEAGTTDIEQLRENVYRVEYRTSAFTSQVQLDRYLRRRCAELTLREGYDFFHLAQRTDVLALSRRIAITMTLYKGHKPVGAANLYDAKEVLTETATVLDSQ